MNTLWDRNSSFLVATLILDVACCVLIAKKNVYVATTTHLSYRIIGYVLPSKIEFSSDWAQQVKSGFFVHSGFCSVVFVVEGLTPGSHCPENFVEINRSQFCITDRKEKSVRKFSFLLRMTAYSAFLQHSKTTREKMSWLRWIIPQVVIISKCVRMVTVYRQ